MRQTQMSLQTDTISVADVSVNPAVRGSGSLSLKALVRVTSFVNLCSPFCFCLGTVAVCKDLEVPSPFFPGILLSRKPPKERWLKRVGNQPLE